MKQLRPALALLSLTIVIAGCNKTADQPADSQMDKVTRETKTAARDIKDYTYAEKAEFIAKMRSESVAVHADLDKLSAKVEKATDQAKADARPKLQALRDRLAKLDQQIAAANDATESTWNEVKTGFKKGYGDLQEEFRQARQWVSDKIAP